MSRCLPVLAPTSSRPGVALSMVDFTHFGEGRVPFTGGQFVVGPGATSRPDAHDVTECWMIARGTGLLHYDGADHRVSEGDCLLFEPRKTHYLHNDGDADVVIYTVWWLEHAS